MLDESRMMAMPVACRQASYTDLDVLVPLFDAYRMFYGQPSQPSVCRAFLDARLTRGESVIHLAFDDRRAIGFVQLYPSFSSVRARPVWWLNDLYVDPSARGTGAGRALLDCARQHALATGAAGVMLETGADNALAQGLYARHGYSRIDPASHFYWLSLE